MEAIHIKASIAARLLVSDPKEDLSVHKFSSLSRRLPPEIGAVFIEMTSDFFRFFKNLTYSL
ncbi:Hypothetical protein DIP1760 [Corynebacterium diphtheriae]|uniref:Uncharacterized protein n=1 Tax=Corynebacterium diphtheriae (strain ATCC 700971 / NCTC 13129 / Biotype gravis) TaxID=257309 RepID=Q6NFX5_CORDI|nr:hypothetical protein CDCE8392_1658 [Corynebacterium diphtheriae CDCE 8392]ARB87857.1 hypothetical protein A6J36_05525 [Corynebacterium diphtheriae]OLN13474.1 hypothetical protein BUE62_04405 [Corynebacterium diphtheriae]OLN20659.1 hypothetical protein BUE67_01645 [Corynebacterium diphtheriae]OLO15413.1 hypothetical protein BUV99_01020 [Corynebacterium diphtheriae]